MILQTIIDQLAASTGVSDPARLLYYVNLAGIDIHFHSDFPGTLQEQIFQKLPEFMITLPWYVRHVRAVKGCDKLAVQLNTPTPAYFDSVWRQSPWTWRVLQITPLLQNVDQATQVTVRLQKAETADVTVYLVGPTDVATECVETLVIPAGQTQVQSVNSFADFKEISKNRPTNTDVEVIDVAGTKLAFIPNHILQARNTRIQVMDRCYNWQPCCVNVCNCIDILFKPYFFGWSSANAYVMDEMYTTLLYRALEHAKLQDEGDVATYAQKASNIADDIGGDYSRGKIIKIHGPRNPYTARYFGHL